MTAFEVLILILLTIIATAFILLAVKGSFTIRFEKHIIEEKKIDPLQLEIAKKNLEELEKYNKKEETAQQKQEELAVSMTEAIQNLFEVNDESESQRRGGVNNTDQF